MNGSRQPRPINLSDSNGGKRATGKLRRKTERKMIMLLILLLVILLLVLTPAWPYSRSWGYYPSGTMGAALVVVIALVLLGHFHF
jgi:polyferredoxin